MWRYLAPRWAVGHLVVAAVAVLFLRLGWWQWGHARAGNAISYGYALQWPTFAAFGIFFWIRIVGDRMRRHTASPELSGDHNEVDREIEADAEPQVGPSWSFRPELIPAEVRRATDSTDANGASTHR